MPCGESSRATAMSKVPADVGGPRDDDPSVARLQRHRGGTVGAAEVDARPPGAAAVGRVEDPLRRRAAARPPHRCLPAADVVPATTILPSGCSATAVALSVPPRLTRDQPVPGP